MKKGFLLALIIIFAAFFIAACDIENSNNSGDDDSADHAGDDTDDDSGDDSGGNGTVKVSFDWEDETQNGSSSWSDSTNEDECQVNAGTDGSETYLLLGCTNGEEALNISIPKKKGTYTISLDSYLKNKSIYLNTTINHLWDFSLLYYTSLSTNQRVYYDGLFSTVTVTVTEFDTNLLHATFSGTITRQDLNEDQYQLTISNGVVDFHNTIGYYSDPYDLKRQAPFKRP